MKEKYTIPWGPIRSMLSELSFSDIKYIIGFTNIDMTKLSHLEQKSSGGATKDQLLNAIGRELNSLNEQFQKKAIVVCCEEILAKHPEWEERLLQALSRVGWKFANGILLPIEILDYEDIINIKVEAHKDIMKAAVKFRDGDFSGSISSSCSAIDSVVTLIYQNNNSDPKGESFQKKILQSFKFIGFENKIKSELSDLMWEEKDIKLFYDNISQSLKQAAFVMQALRSKMSDVHGSKPALSSHAYNSLKWSLLILNVLSE